LGFGFSVPPPLAPGNACGRPCVPPAAGRTSFLVLCNDRSVRPLSRPARSNRQEHVDFARRETRDSFCRSLRHPGSECNRKIATFLISEFGHPSDEICIMWGLSGLHTDEALTQHLVLPRARSCWHTMRRRDQPPSGDVRSGPPHSLDGPIRRVRAGRRPLAVDASREVLGLQLPIGAAIWRAFAAPTE